MTSQRTSACAQTSYTETDGRQTYRKYCTVLYSTSYVLLASTYVLNEDSYQRLYTDDYNTMREYSSEIIQKKLPARLVLLIFCL